jgi:hypothetical protein
MRDVTMLIVKAQSGVSVIPSLERCVTTLRFSTKTYADDDARLVRRDRPMILDGILTGILTKGFTLRYQPRIDSSARFKLKIVI